MRSETGGTATTAASAAASTAASKVICFQATAVDTSPDRERCRTAFSTESPAILVLPPPPVSTRLPKISNKLKTEMSACFARSPSHPHRLARVFRWMNVHGDSLSPTAQPTSSPATSGPTSVPTPAPTTLEPTAGPTAAPTQHICNDGAHGCDATEHGICEQIGASAGHRCGCARTHRCSDGSCSTAGHTCVWITAAPTPAPTASPHSSSPTSLPTAYPSSAPTSTPTRYWENFVNVIGGEGALECTFVCFGPAVCKCKPYLQCDRPYTINCCTVTITAM